MRRPERQGRSERLDGRPDSEGARLQPKELVVLRERHHLVGVDVDVGRQLVAEDRIASNGHLQLCAVEEDFAPLPARVRAVVNLE